MEDDELSRSRFAKPFLFRICMLCTYTRPRYQVSVFQDHWSSGIFKELGSTDNYFRGAWEQAHTFWDSGSSGNRTFKYN